MTSFRSKAAQVAAVAVRMALGVLFVVSAVAKLLSIDEFEIYLFSYDVLSLRLSMLAARLVIVAEALVGIGLLANVWNRFVNICALLMVVVFTVFLCLSALAGRTDNCHCMGSIIEMNPTQSIVKNAVLLVLLLVAAGARPWRWKPRWYLWLPAILIPTVTVFVVSAPDYWLFGPQEEIYNREELDKAIAPEGELAPAGLANGKHVVAFFSPGCPYCHMADEKLAHIEMRNRLNKEAFVCFIPMKDSTMIPMSVDSTAFTHPCYRLTNMTYALITYGQRPMVFLIEDGAVKATCHYRNIDEHQITLFLNDDEK